MGLVLLLGLAAGACLAARLPEAPAEVEAPAAHSAPPDPWKSRGLAPVRLAAAEGLLRLEVELAPGQRAVVAREGDGVRVLLPGAAPELLPWVRIDPLTANGELRFEGRSYPGSLLIEPRPGGGLGALNWAPLEAYVEGVVAAELVLWNSSAAAIQAQAIAARSYAVATLEARALGSRRPELWDDTRDQAYRGRFLPDSAARTRGLDRLLADSVAGCRGLVLDFSGRVLAARYHACCGGRTADEAAVFSGVSGPSLSVTCEPCRQAGERSIREASTGPGSSRAPTAASKRTAGRTAFDPSWSFTAARSDLDRLARELGLGDRLRTLTPVKQDAAQRWLEVELVGNQGKRRLPFNELRRRLGFDRLRSGRILSTWPRAGETIQDGLYFSGLGNGHGVGLCQRGALGYAELGLGAERILAHYYPGARIRGI
jgi:stage II sporulation protein D